MIWPQILMVFFILTQPVFKILFTTTAEYDARILQWAVKWKFLNEIFNMMMQLFHHIPPTNSS